MTTRRFESTRREDLAETSFGSYPPARGISPFASSNAQRLPQRTTKITQKLVLFPEGEEPSRGGLETHQFDKSEDGAQSMAERLTKAERLLIPRVTSYCCAESFNLQELIEYLKEAHGINAKQYDECLYFYYEGTTKEMKFGDPSGRYSIPLQRSISVGQPGLYASLPNIALADDDHPTWVDRGEVFIFDYGVLVLWNFTSQEEANFLSHMKPFTEGYIQEGEMEIEDFHFQYDITGSFQPRIFNDMITLKSSSPLIKLTISHGLAQSVKLSLFENIMEETIRGAVPYPKNLAKFGVVKMSRTKVMKIVGHLYKLKMNVNLVSNVLDTPEMFWSEPGLEGLYRAIRGYLEISQRATLLNTRVDVLTDLLSMLSDHLNSSEETYITWIVIILICGAVVIAIAEVFVKVMRLKAGFDD